MSRSTRSSLWASSPILPSSPSIWALRGSSPSTGNGDHDAPGIGSGNIGRLNASGQVVQGPAADLLVDLTSIPVNPPQAVMPGGTWNFQYWYRDVGNSKNFTDAIAITYQ